jgi:hypothetical protein
MGPGPMVDVWLGVDTGVGGQWRASAPDEASGDW